MTDRHFHILGSPGFLIGLLLLLLNDFVFKAQFHNAFTGKLSDFAGLFVFPLFWVAFFPRRKNSIYIATAVLFVFWKSVHSQFVIEGWNSLPFFGVERTVDYSDLWALLVLPLAYLYSDVSAGAHVPRRLVHLIAIISVVAFTATSFHQKNSFNNQYQFPSSSKQLLERMSRLPKDEVHKSYWEGDTFEITFDDCNNRATIIVQERDNQSVITLTQIENRCPTTVEPDEMRLYFEKEFIDKLRQEPVSKSAAVERIWSTTLPLSSNTESLPASP